MKITPYLFILATLSCNNQQKQPERITDLHSSEQESANKIEHEEHYTTKDTIFIPTERGDTLIFTKKKYNLIVNNHPEFFDDYIYSPDRSYYSNYDFEHFGSEAGQDTYYSLYAHFLKQKNGIDKYAKQRKKLIDIYSNINSLFGHFQYGGTSFGHQNIRILGYAEYAITHLPENEEDFEKTYDIKKQKQLYIKSLRQLIADEIAIDSYTLGDEKLIRIKKLNEIVDELDALITDVFYLRKAQKFHYQHYEYF